MFATDKIAASAPVLAIEPLVIKANRYAENFSTSVREAGLPPKAFSWPNLRAGRYDVVLFHWPDFFFRRAGRKTQLVRLATMLYAKIRWRTKFVWLVHNLEPHDSVTKTPNLAARLFMRLLDGLMFLSASSRRDFEARYPAARALPYLITVLGRYAPVVGPPRANTRAERRNRLLFFGLIRDYKNVDALVVEAQRVADPAFTLTVTGSCSDPELKARIMAAAGEDPRIRLDIRDSLVPEDELEREIDAHDAVVMPYKRILNSAVALHALGRNKPILAPAVGSLPELRDKVGKDWVHLFEGSISTQDIERFMADIGTAEAAEPDLSAYEWARVGDDVADFLVGLASPSDGKARV